VKRERGIAEQMVVVADRGSTKKDRSALQAQYTNIAHETHSLSVAVAVMDVPKCVAASHRVYVRSLSAMYLVASDMSSYESELEGTDEVARVDSLAGAVRSTREVQSETATWWFQLRAVAGALHARVPFSNPWA
jgi:hypothetical protein